MRLISILAFLFCTKSFANIPIVKCKVNNDQWTGIISLDSTGVGLLKFKRKGIKKTLSCPLSLEFIEDQIRGVSPNITIEFLRGDCDPNDKIMSSEVFKNITLMINTQNKNQPTSKLQWLRSIQPEYCKIQKIRIFDIRMNTKKWRKGLWGRSVTSEKKR